MRVNLEDVVNAIESVSDGTEFYYYIPEEEIIVRQEGQFFDDFLPEDFDVEEYPDDVIALPDRYEINDYQNMVKYIASLKDSNAAEWLNNAIHGRGAFRMFRATAERFGLLNDWYDFLEQQHRLLAAEWCDNHGIEYAVLDDEPYEEDDEDEEEEVVVRINKYAAPLPARRIVTVTRDNYQNAAFMHAACIAEMAKLKGQKVKEDPEAAGEDLLDQLDHDRDICAVSELGRFIGYMIWNSYDVPSVEMIYVRPEFRRQGIGKMLVDHAAEDYDDIYFDVPPQHQVMKDFLNALGYGEVESIRMHKG